MSTGRKNKEDRLRLISMDGISLDDALRGAMAVPPPAEDKPKSKKKAKRKAKRKKKARK